MDLEAIVAEVLAAKRHRHVSPDLVRRLAETELIRPGSARLARKELIKAVKTKLHQAVGAFGDEALDARRLIDRLRAAGSPDELTADCREALRLHSSTRERLPEIERFYAVIWAETGLPGVVLDLGCGLAPLSLPWMGLPDATLYLGYEADTAAVEIANVYLALVGRPKLVEARDLVARPPTEPADVALVLKLLPTLDQQQPGAGLALLDSLNARFAVVSYPARSLGGRDKGMARTYDGQVAAILAARPAWKAQRLDLTTELVYVIDRGST